MVSCLLGWFFQQGKLINSSYDQFVNFQTLSEEELPNGALAGAIIWEFEDEDGKTQNDYKMDVLWYHLQSMKRPVGNNKRFNILFGVAQIVLLIPHSNAASECLFSFVNKNKNESSDRNRLIWEKDVCFVCKMVY